jgi:hypothetical protein
MRPLVEYEKASGSTTDPTDILADILAEIGISANRVDLTDSWVVAATNYTSFGITWNGGFYRAEARERVLNSLLTQADSMFYSGEKIELRMFDATVKETFDTSKIKKLSFRPSRRTKTGHDSGHVSWAVDGQPQNSLPGKALVPVGSTTANPDSEIFSCPFINDSELAQDLGTLYFRRKLTAKDTVSFDSSGDKLDNLDSLKPGDVVRIDDTSLYGENRLLIIKSLTIKKDLTVSISGDTYDSVEDLSSITSTPIAVSTDDISPTFPMPTYGATFGVDIDGGGTSENQVGDDGYVTVINADIITTGSLTSTNWAAGAGSQFNLLDGTFKLGGSSSPALEWDGVNLTIDGTISATTGEIGGWTIETNALTADEITIDSNIPAILMGSADTFSTGDGAFLGKSSGVYKFRIGNPSGSYLSYENGNLIITGAVQSGTEISGTTANTFTVNSDLDDTTAKLVLGRTTGGNAEISWDGSVIGLDENASFSGNVSITGNLTVLGTEFIADVTTVRIEDNLAIINYGETGPGITAGFAGWEADRGTLTNYKWGFDETTDTWRVGEDGSLQAVATRNDSPDDLGLAYWNDTENRFDTLSTVTVSAGGKITAVDLTLTTPSDVYNLSHDSFADFVSDEHVAHSGVTITAGNGLTGGGTIAATRTLTMGTPNTLTNATTNGVTTESHTHAITNYALSGTANQVTVTGAGKLLGEAATLSLPQDIDTGATPTFTSLTLSQATGSAPLAISSTTKVANLNADTVDGVNVASLTNGRLTRYNSTGTQIENATVTESAGALGGITTLNMSGQLTNTLAIGTAPFVVTSTTRNVNLNADLWDGYEFDDYLNQAVKTDSSPVFVTAKLSALTDGYIPYHISDASGLSDGPIYTDGTKIGIGTTTLTEILNVQGNLSLDGDLKFVGAQSITTSVDGLTLSPAGNLTLSPGGTTQTDADIETDNFVSQTTGWQVSYAGNADFRNIYADELTVKAFTADVYSALAGGVIITKSRAEITRDFTIPNTGLTATLYVSDHEGIADTAVFVAGDYVRLRVIDRSGGGLVVSDIYGTVTGYTNLSGGEQSWTFETTTPGYSSSDIIYAGSIALDYGQVGSGSKGVWEVTVLDSAGSPYSQVQTWSEITDGEPATFTTHVRTGNLDGLSGIGLEYGLYAGQGLTDSDAYVLVTDSQVDLHNIPLTFNDGTNTTIKIDPSTPSLAIGATIPTAFATGDGIWAGLDSGAYKFRAGDVDGEQIYWDGSNIVVGNDSAEHIKSDGSQLQFLNGATERANLSGDVWTLGNTSTEHVAISTTSVQFKDGTDVYTDLTAGVLNLGLESGGEYMQVDSTGISMYQNDAKLVALESDALKIYSPQSEATLVTTDGDTLVTTDGDTLVAETDQRAEYGESMWVGAGATQERLEWNTTDGLFIADPDGTKVFQITPAGVTTFSGAIDGATAAGVTLIDGDYLSSGLISADRIDTGTLSADRIGARSITAAKIAAGTITATEIEAGTITATEIAANTILASNIAAGTITATEIESGTITATEITGTTLSGIFADIGEVTAGILRSSDPGTYLDLDNKQLYFGGKSGYENATDGIFIGYDTDGYKVDIGDSTTYFRYDGSFEVSFGTGDSFNLAGDLNVSDDGQISVAGSAGIKCGPGGDIQITSVDETNVGLFGFNDYNNNAIGITNQGGYQWHRCYDLDASEINHSDIFMDGNSVQLRSQSYLSISFTSGGTTEPEVGQFLKGDTSGARMQILEVVVDTGTWAGGDAAGYFRVGQLFSYLETETASLYSDSFCTVLIQSNVANTTEPSAEDVGITGAYFDVYGTGFVLSRYRLSGTLRDIFRVYSDGVDTTAFLKSSVDGNCTFSFGNDFSNTTNVFSVGLDNADSDNFKISVGDTLGTGDVFVIDNSGNIDFTGVSRWTQTNDSTAVSVDSIELENLSTTGLYSPSIVFSQNQTNDNAVKILSRYDRRLYVQKTDDDWVTEDSLLMLSSDVSVVYSDFRVEGHLDIKEVSTAPATFGGYGRLYTKSDNKLYFKDGDGTEHEVAFI